MNRKVNTPFSLRKFLACGSLFSSGLKLPREVWIALEDMKLMPLTYVEFANRLGVSDNEGRGLIEELFDGAFIEDVTRVVIYHKPEVYNDDTPFVPEIGSRVIDSEIEGDQIAAPQAAEHIEQTSEAERYEAESTEILEENQNTPDDIVSIEVVSSEKPPAVKVEKIDLVVHPDIISDEINEKSSTAWVDEFDEDGESEPVSFTIG